MLRLPRAQWRHQTWRGRTRGDENRCSSQRPSEKFSRLLGLDIPPQSRLPWDEVCRVGYHVLARVVPHQSRNSSRGPPACVPTAPASSSRANKSAHGLALESQAAASLASRRSIAASKAARTQVLSSEVSL